MSVDLHREEQEQGTVAPPQVEREASRRADVPRHAASPGLAGLPRAIWQAGNTAISRLLGRQNQGRPLDAATMMAMQQGLGADLSDVRIHDDAEAQAAADTINAKAFTQGSDVYLSKDAPPPQSLEGRDLIAHELAHVVQQREPDTVDPGRMSEPGDRSERVAEGAAQNMVQGRTATISGGGAVAGTQRQMRGQGASRAEVERALTQYFQRALQAQSGRSLRVTDEMRTTVMMLADAPDPSYRGPGGDPGRAMRWISLQPVVEHLPSTPEEAARQIARRLPEPFDRATLQRLTGAAVEPTTTRFGRVGSLIERSAPGEPPPEQQIAQWRFEQEARELRSNEGAVGPYGVDVPRIGRIVQGLPGALKGPRRQPSGPEARSYPEVERAIQQISANALVPAEARGADAGDYANAQEVAREVARQLDIAQQQQQEGIVLRLGANYNSVRNQDAILSELARIVRLIKDALPHHASSVRYVNVFFGDRNVRRIPLNIPAR